MQTYNDGTGDSLNEFGAKPTTYTITVLDWQRMEWARCAQAMYARGRNDLGHMLSAAATFHILPTQRYDAVSKVYRAWLCFDEPKS